MGLFGPSKNAALTEKNLPDQTGKVFIVTGASAGVGRELAQILYSHNATVYVAARSEGKALSVIEEIKTATPNSTGKLVFLHLDLNDLSTVKKSATEFLSKESKLHVLWNNAGVMIPPQGSVTAQNYELQLGTNNLAPFLFTKLLTPTLVSTAKESAPGTVRVVWVASSAAERFSPKGGVVMENLDYKTDQGAWHKYGVSKAGNVLQATEYAKRFGSTGVLSFSVDPGNLKTDLYKNMPGWQRAIVGLILAEPIFGAYSELFAGLSESIVNNNGAFIQPYGVLGKARSDIEASSKSQVEGGTGVGEKFWAWNEEQIAPYV